MPDETYYKVTIPVELTVRSDTGEWAIDAAIAAVGEAVGGAVTVVYTDRGEAVATKVEYDPDEMARMKTWLERTKNANEEAMAESVDEFQKAHDFPAKDFETNGIHMMTPEEIRTLLEHTDPRDFNHEV